MTVQTKKQAVDPFPSPLQGSADGPSQLLCLPKGRDTVAQLAPTGPCLELSQSNVRRQPRKPLAIDNSHSTPPYLQTAWPFLQGAKPLTADIF